MHLAVVALREDSTPRASQVGEEQTSQEVLLQVGHRQAVAYLDPKVVAARQGARAEVANNHAAVARLGSLVEVANSHAAVDRQDDLAELANSHVEAALLHGPALAICFGTSPCHHRADTHLCLGSGTCSRPCHGSGNETAHPCRGRNETEIVRPCLSHESETFPFLC